MSKPVLILNQGTTHTTASLVGSDLKVRATCSVPTPATYAGQNRWVLDAEAIWSDTLEVIQTLLNEQQLEANDLAALGLTNQRESVVVWNRSAQGQVHAALSWQDRRSSELCTQWYAQGHEPMFQERTGLILDPQFSAPKLHHLFKYEMPDLQDRAERGELCVGTIDSFLLWRFSRGRVHATDATNAARTLLYQLQNQCWDSTLLQWFNIPECSLAEVKDSASFFAETDPEWFGASIPILAMLGDQQASLLGHGCFAWGDVKASFGTGCFALANTERQRVQSQHRLISTLAWQIKGQPTYALEGTVFSAGSIIDWLEEDLLNLGTNHQSLLALAESVPMAQTEVIIPALAGLGAPHWDQEVRGAMFGLSRDTRLRHLIAAALRSVAFQTENLLNSMRYDDIPLLNVFVDGETLNHPWFFQNLSDITGLSVYSEDTQTVMARGVAMLCGLELGWAQTLQDYQPLLDRSGAFHSQITDAERDRALRQWEQALSRLQAPH